MRIPMSLWANKDEMADEMSKVLIEYSQTRFFEWNKRERLLSEAIQWAIDYKKFMNTRYIPNTKSLNLIIANNSSIFYSYIMNGELSASVMKELLSTAIREAAKATYEAMIVDEQSKPKTKCLNAENHLFGSCFECKKIDGWNAAREQSIKQGKEFLGIK